MGGVHKPRVRTFTGGRCHLCKKVNDLELISLPIVTLDGTTKTLPIHSLCAYKFVTQQRAADVERLQQVIAMQNERIIRAETHMSRLIDNERYRAASALLKLSL